MPVFFFCGSAEAHAGGAELRLRLYVEHAEHDAIDTTAACTALLATFQAMRSRTVFFDSGHCAKSSVFSTFAAVPWA